MTHSIWPYFWIILALFTVVGWFVYPWLVWSSPKDLQREHWARYPWHIHVLAWVFWSYFELWLWVQFWREGPAYDVKDEVDPK